MYSGPQDGACRIWHHCAFVLSCKQWGFAGTGPRTAHASRPVRIRASTQPKPHSYRAKTSCRCLPHPRHFITSYCAYSLGVLMRRRQWWAAVPRGWRCTMPLWTSWSPACWRPTAAAAQVQGLGGMCSVAHHCRFVSDCDVCGCRHPSWMLTSLAACLQSRPSLHRIWRL